MCRCRTKEALYQIGQRAYFAVGQFSGPTGNRKAGREGADKDGPVADWRTDVFAKSDEFVDQLLTFKRSPVHPVRDQDQAGNTVRGTRIASTISSVRMVASRSKAVKAWSVLLP